MMMTFIRNLVRSLYSISGYYLIEIPAQIYVNKFVHSSHWDQKELTIKVAEQDDFDRMSKQIEKFKYSTRIAERTRRGDRCVVVYKDGAVAHFRWIAFGDVEIPELGSIIMHLGSDEAYTYDAQTIPAFRRRGISSQAKNFQVAYLLQQGMNTIYTITGIANPVTRRARTKRTRQGRQRTIGIISMITLFGSKHYRFQSKTVEDCQTIANLFHLHPQQITIENFSSIEIR